MEGSGRVLLQCNQQVPPGTELCLNYGLDSNEALLFRYGFVQENNEHDKATLLCPLGPKHEWDTSMHTKIKLLRVRPVFRSIINGFKRTQVVDHQNRGKDL